MPKRSKKNKVFNELSKQIANFNKMPYNIKKLYESPNYATTSLKILGIFIGMVIFISNIISYLGGISAKLIDNIQFPIFDFSFNEIYLIILFLVIFISAAAFVLHSLLSQQCKPPNIYYSLNIKSWRR